MKVTDYERVANVTPGQWSGQIQCPKCFATCKERSPDRRHGPRREWDCAQCGRGWIEVADWVNTVDDAHNDAEAAEQHG